MGSPSFSIYIQRDNVAMTMKRKTDRMITKATLTNGERIDAITRKAAEHKMSYGIFVAALTESDKEQIFEEYAAYLEAYRENQAKVLKEYTKNKHKNSHSHQL